MDTTRSNQTFRSALEHVLRYEGGYVDHPSDPGGATKFGITRKTLAKFRHISPWWKLPKSEVKQLGRVETAKIYHQNYWRRIRADDLPEALAFAVFDYAVNSGPHRAICTLQQVVKTKMDGQIGPKTLKAIAVFCDNSPLKVLIADYITARHGFLKKLRIYAVFGAGWRTRLSRVRDQAFALLAKQHSQKGKPTLNIFKGYKTYLVALFMIVAGLMEMAGIDIPAIEAGNALHLVLEAFAVLFLRKGIKSEIANA